MAIAERELLSAHATPMLVTEEEYLTREEAANVKSEYIHGRIVPMSGGTLNHAVIAANTISALILSLRGKGCRVMSSDMKVWTAGAFYYPDISVVRESPIFWGQNRTVVTNPILVTEVLSQSTEEQDRGEKFRHYQQIESLQAYLLVSQDAPEVELFSRGENGQWDYSASAGLASRLEIPCLSISLALADIFEQIDFDQTN